MNCTIFAIVGPNQYALKRMNKRLKRILPMLLVFTLVAGPVVMTSCQPKVCPANNKAQFNKKRARYAKINHLNRRGGKGQKRHKSRHRKPEFGYFKTRFNKRQFKHQTR